MIRNTFIHLPRIGPKTEQKLWSLDILSWEDFTQRVEIPCFSEATRSRYCEWITKSEDALAERNIRFFSENLPRREFWRLYPEWRNDTVFLDIETTGLSRYYHEITLIGLYDGKDVQTFIKGKNLHEFENAIRHYSVIVTFNGAQFDIPFLKTELGDIQLPPVHIDLRFLLRRLGYRGGLKIIEEQVGIRRQEDVADIDGYGATVLWKRYIRGNDEALELLIKYNVEDIVNLKTLLELAYQTLHNRTLPQITLSKFT